MARRVFFSFHYQRDIWRVNQIRNLGQIVGTSAAGFHDSSLWEEAKRQGDAAIKRMIDNALVNTSVTVVCIGAASAGRRYIDYEISQSIARGNGLLGIQIHGLKNQAGQTDSAGATPSLLLRAGAPVYSYASHDLLASRIEEAAKRAGK